MPINVEQGPLSDKSTENKEGNIEFLGIMDYQAEEAKMKASFEERGNKIDALEMSMLGNYGKRDDVDRSLEKKLKSGEGLSEIEKLQLAINKKAEELADEQKKAEDELYKRYEEQLEAYKSLSLEDKIKIIQEI